MDFEDSAVGTPFEMKSTLPDFSTPSAGQNDDLTFPDSVQAAIAEVFPSSDPLDAADFSPVKYINELFPTEQSLNNLDDVVSEMRCKIQCIDDDMRRIVRSQTTVEDEATRSLEEAQVAIMELFTQIRDIKAKAAESEAMVRDITRDIKQLDTAKRNLTTAITTLNHLHMLVAGVSTLRQQTRERHYGDAAMLLQGLLQVLQHFENYSNIPQIKDMSSQLKQIQDQLGTQISNDFHAAFSVENAKNLSPSKQLAEACLVVSVLDPNSKVKANLIKFVLKRQLAEYTIMFGDSEEGAWLDKIDNRFNWLKRNLIDFEDHMGPVFPPDWEMSERIAVEFCDLTRKSLERLMFKRKLEIDTKLLLHAIQRTSNFESLLSRRFTGVTLEQYKESVREAETSNTINPFDEPISEDEKNPFFDDKASEAKTSINDTKPNTVDLETNLTPFNGLISQCFESYLDIYIETQNQNLSELVDRAAQEQKNRGYTNLAVEGSSVLHSCGDLFMFYKKCMVQCAQLSTGDPMLALSHVFRRHLKEYANKILIANLPKSSTAGSSLVGSSSSASLTSMTTTLTKDLKDFSTQGFIQNVQSFLKEGEVVRMTADERVFVCSAIVTAEYIIETTQQLEGKLKEKVERRLAEKINFGSEQDVYHGIITQSIQLLVQEMELQVEPALTAMTKMSWSSIESVGDQSPYVTSFFNHIKQTIPLVRDNLASSKKYFTQFCIKFANNFIPKFLQSLYKCRPLSTVGAEQLLLDTHSIKTLLLDLPTVGSKVTGTSGPGGMSGASRKAPASYAKIVIKGMTKAEMILKVVMSPAEPAKGFVEQYSKLLGVEADTMELQKVLDMKGVRKVDQTLYLDIFNQYKVPSNSQPISQSHSSTDLANASKKEAEESRIKKLERLIKKRL